MPTHNSTAAGPPTTFTEATALAYARTLDASSRQALHTALRDLDSAEFDTSIVDIVRTTLAEQFPGEAVTGVVFSTDEYDDGHFLDNYATVFFADGTIEESVRFVGANDLFTDEFGARGEQFKWGINPSTGEIEYDDYGDNIYAFLGVADPDLIAYPAHPTRAPTSL